MTDAPAQPPTPAKSGPSSPAGGQPTAKAPRSSRRTLLIVVAVVVAVCCLGVGGGGFWLYNLVTGETSAVEDAAATHFEHVTKGEFDAAYGNLCEAMRADVSPEVFRQRNSTPAITGYEVVDASVVTVNGDARAFVSVRLTLDPGGQQEFGFPLVSENGQWRICQ